MYCGNITCPKKEHSNRERFNTIFEYDSHHDKACIPIYATSQVLFSNMKTKQQKSVVSNKSTYSYQWLVELQSPHDTGITLKESDNPDDDDFERRKADPKLPDNDSNQDMIWNYLMMVSIRSRFETKLIMISIRIDSKHTLIMIPVRQDPIRNILRSETPADSGRDWWWFRSGYRHSDPKQTDDEFETETNSDPKTWWFQSRCDMELPDDDYDPK